MEQTEEERKGGKSNLEVAQLGRANGLGLSGEVGPVLSHDGLLLLCLISLLICLDTPGDSSVNTYQNNTGVNLLSFLTFVLSIVFYIFYSFSVKVIFCHRILAV